MKRVLSVLSALAVCAAAGGCVREQEVPQRNAAAPTRAQHLPRGAIAEHDIEGKRRAKPCATMGALEADGRAVRPCPKEKTPSGARKIPK